MVYTSEELFKHESIESLRARGDALAQTGIYRITSPSGKSYVGLTTNSFRNRWRGHVRALRVGKHICDHLQSSVNKHGLTNFRFEILEIVNDDTIYLKERDHWDRIKSQGGKLFNGRPAGDGKGVHPTPETNQKRIEKAKLRRTKKLENWIASCPKVLTKANLSQLYYTENMSVQAIAELANLKKGHVLQIMDYLDLPRRTGAETRTGKSAKLKFCANCSTEIAITMFVRHEKKCLALPRCKCGSLLSTVRASACLACYNTPGKGNERKERHRAIASEASVSRTLSELPPGSVFISSGHFVVNGVDIVDGARHPAKFSTGWIVEDRRFKSLKKAADWLALNSQE